MVQSSNIKKNYWWQKNPKTAVFLTTFLIICTIVFVTEILCAYINRQNLICADYYVRYIRLREAPPLMSTYLWPTKHEMDCSDTLKYKKYRFRIDKNGFIVPSEKYPDPDISIVFLGGSTTECTFVEEENRFPYLVGCLLENKLKKKINSYNGGVAGNNFMHSLFSLMAKVFPIKPTTVILMHNINDLTILLYEKTYYNDNTYKSLIVTENFNLWQLTRIFIKKLIPNIYQASLQLVDLRRFVRQAEHGDEYAHIRGAKVTCDKAMIIREIDTNLRLFIQVCKIKNVTPVLMTMASRIKENPDAVTLKEFKTMSSNLSYLEFRELFDDINNTIRRTADENRIRCIDLARQIPQEKEYIYDMFHYNDNGCIKVSQIISNELVPLLSEGR